MNDQNMKISLILVLYNIIDQRLVFIDFIVAQHEASSKSKFLIMLN